MSAPSLPSLVVSHWALSASLVVPVVAVASLYGIGAKRVRGWPARRLGAFLGGLGCVVVALQSGLGTYDDQLLSVHMAQHMLLLMVAPLLLLGGSPVVLLLSALPRGRRRAVGKLLIRLRAYTGPAQSLGFFTAVVVLTHLPSFYDATLRHPLLHYIEHALYLLAGLLMWSPLVDGDPAPRHRLDGLARIGYLIVAMLPMALVGAYLNRHATVFYPAYGPPARALGISAVDDQATAGAIMWVVGNVIMVIVGLWAALAAMVAEERRQVARDARAAS
jgi:cytochrome c oxidase assembly factor CtaG